MFCFLDMFEGEVCGFVKNLVFMIYIIIDVFEVFLVKLVFMFGVEDIFFVIGNEFYWFGVFMV